MGPNAVAKIKRICYCAFMQVRSCRVTIRDIDGMSHTVEVTASTFYEAVAQALAALRGHELVAGRPAYLTRHQSWRIQSSSPGTLVFGIAGHWPAFSS